MKVFEKNQLFTVISNMSNSYIAIEQFFERDIIKQKQITENNKELFNPIIYLTDYDLGSQHDRLISEAVKVDNDPYVSMGDYGVLAVVSDTCLDAVVAKADELELISTNAFTTKRPKKPKKQKMKIQPLSLDIEVVKALSKQADANDRSMSAEANRILKRELLSTSNN